MRVATPNTPCAGTCLSMPALVFLSSVLDRTAHTSTLLITSAKNRPPPCGSCAGTCRCLIDAPCGAAARLRSGQSPAHLMAGGARPERQDAHTITGWGDRDGGRRETVVCKVAYFLQTTARSRQRPERWARRGTLRHGERRPPATCEAAWPSVEGDDPMAAALVVAGNGQTTCQSPVWCVLPFHALQCAGRAHINESMHKITRRRIMHAKAER